MQRNKINCKKIIQEYLIQNGFDGLYSEDEDCGCDLNNLVPCDNDFSRCRPGYKIIPPKEIDCEYDFYICENKTDKPYEDYLNE